MIQIEVTPEIAEQIMRSGEAVEIVDSTGRRVGFVSRPITDDEIQEARYLADMQSGGSGLDDV